MATFRLDPLPSGSGSPALPAGDGPGGAVALQDAHWFTHIRWVVVVALIALGAIAALFPDSIAQFGLVPPRTWPLVLAGVLTLVNIAVMASLRRLPPQASRRTVAANIWIQIVADLLVLTTLVHLVGSIRTVISFAYLFHIALACIFFGRRESFLVTLLSAALFCTLIGLEVSGLLERRSIMAFARPSPADVIHAVIFVVPALFVWFVMWYLVSTISQALRRRDRELDAANKRLLQADAEKNLQMLRVTHDLKSPFAGIESNIETLKAEHWNDIPGEAREIIGRIEARGATLRARIGDILTLGDLRSAGPEPVPREPVALKPLLEATVHELQGLAAQRRVGIELTTPDLTLPSNPRQLKVLLANLITNAVSYSNEGGRVTVEVKPEAAPRIRISDQGIGISAEALPHIFEDFYRAREAARFNPQSTGLGLAIVRQAARNLGLAISVESEPGKGTSFEIVFPPPHAHRTPP